MFRITAEAESSLLGVLAKGNLRSDCPLDCSKAIFSSDFKAEVSTVVF